MAIESESENMVSDREQAASSDAGLGKVGGTRILAKVLAAAAGIVVLAGIGAGMHSMWPVDQALGSHELPEESGKRVPVVLTAAKDMTFESTVVVSGSFQAKNYALVSARMPGSLDAIYVDKGDAVQAGRTELFQSDSLKLTKAVAMTRQGLQVAELSVNEKEANLEQVQANREQAEVDLERYRVLIHDNAIPKQLFDQQETRLKQASAMVRHAEALLALDRTKLEQARLSLLMAEKDLADSLVIAPISGKVSQRFMEPGEMAAPGTPVLKIEDLSLLEVSVFLPEEHYARVLPEQTQMRIAVSGSDLGARPVAYKSPTVNPKMRTFEVKALLDQPPPSVAPGCLAEVVIVLDVRRGLGVPAAAIQQRGGESVVFVVEAERVRLLTVKPGRSMHGWTEILDGHLTTGMAVITMGQHLVSDGTLVTAVEEAAR
jgi:RND family efflux transporter MFP subunit